MSFHNAADIKTFTLAGHAKITLESLRTGKWYTYQVNQAKDRETGELQPRWFVALLSGPNNDGDYTYLGMLDSNGFRLTQASKLKADSLPVRGFQFFWRHIEADKMPAEMEVRHSGHCGRCGRTLTTPESITRGIGPDCWSQMGGM